MNININKKSDFLTTKWSGGATTEIAIFPESAKYSQRNFQYRISTATIEVEQSEFTLLPGFSRVLMILDGSGYIIHEGRFEAELKKYQSHNFSGDWKTSFLGMATDFNLMTTENYTGNLQVLIIEKTSSVLELLVETNSLTGFYFYKGLANIKTNSEIINCEEGDFISFTELEKNGNIEINAIQDCEIIVVKVCCNS